MLAADDGADFEIGPMMIEMMGDNGSHPEWTSTGAFDEHIETDTGGIAIPVTGTATVSFYVPDDLELAYSGMYALMEMAGGTSSGQMYLRRATSGAGGQVYLCADPVSGTTDEAEITLSAGAHAATHDLAL